MTTKTDAELVKQLKTASDNEQLVEAVVRLKSEDPSQIVPESERTEELTNQLMKRVEKQSGQAPSRYNVFKNLGSFVVAADATFIRELMSQPEVASIMANQQPDSALIPPVKKAPVPPLPKRAKPAPRKRKAKPAASKKAAGKSAR